MIRFLAEYTPGHDVYNLATGKISQKAGTQDTSGVEVRGRIDIDARTETPYGTIQSVLWLRGINQDGLRNTATSTEFVPAIVAGGNATTTVTMERGYVNFAGLTAGVNVENFTTFPDYMFGPVIYGGFTNGVKQLAYTYAFGGGISGTLALEAKSDMGGNVVNAGNGSPLGTSLVPYATSVQYNNQLDSEAVLVGNIRDDAKWGFIQANFALTKNTINGTTLNSTYSPLNDPTSSLGWAAGFSLRYLMPFVAPGDEFRFQAAYDNGLIGLVKSAGSLNDVSDATMKRGIGGIITVPQNMIPTTVTAAGVVTGVGQSTSYSAVGMYTHYFSPEWRTNFDVGYMQLFMPTAYSNGVAAGLNTQEGNARLFGAGINLIWSPGASRNLDIGIELDYVNLVQSIQNPSAAFIAAGQPGLKGDALTAIFRINRLF
jgi:hypothetical protein